MRALAIDTSSQRASVVLWENGRSSATEHNDDPKRHAETLAGLIERALASAGWSKKQIDLISCCVGPGSFTGVRVGLSCAKGLALGLNRPIVGVGSLAAMAYDVKLDRGEVVVPLLDARKGEVFWAAYDVDRACVAGPGHVTASRVREIFDALGTTNPVVVGEITSRLDVGSRRVLRGETTDVVDGTVIARIGIEIFAERGADDLDALEPTYVRPPDITLPAHRTDLPIG